jgi:lysophospholipase L1-like esterase
MLGDSVTFGDYVAEDETLPAALERALAAHEHRVEVVNAGVGSIGAADMPPLLEQALGARPDLVLVGLYLNDAQRSLFLEPAHGWGRRSRAVAWLQGRVARWRVERAWNAQIEARRPALDAFLAGHRVDAGFDREVATAFADWGYAWSPQAWREIEAAVAPLRDRARGAGVPIAVVLLPVRLQVESEHLRAEPQRHFASTMERLGVPHGDVLPALRRAAATTTAPLFYDHCHYTPLGNQVVGEAIAAWLNASAL